MQYFIKKCGLLITLCSVICSLSAQNMPFPQSKKFAGCIKPNHITQDEMNETVSSFYNFWKNSYLKTSKSTPNGYYISTGGGTGGTDSTITVSEGHGWGMVIMALMAGSGSLADPNARTYYDGLFRFYNAHPSELVSRLMSWQVFGDSNHENMITTPSATDGDLDIAYSMLLAHHQWGSDSNGVNFHYLDSAKDMIHNGIRIADVGRQTFRTTLGDWDEPNQFQTRPSDWMPGHFHSFYAATSYPMWNVCANKIYELYSIFTSKYSINTGLISDFVVKEEIEPAPQNFLDEFKETDSYFNNACRFPWRIATDYAHHSAPAAKDACNKIINWLKPATSQNPTRIGFGYFLSGQPINTNYYSLAYIAPFIAACIVDPAHQDYLNDGWDTIKSSNNEGYYGNTIKLLCMLLISGNWWRPGEKIVAIGDDIMPDMPKDNSVKITSNNISGNLTISYYLNSVSTVNAALYNSRGIRVVSMIDNSSKKQGAHLVNINLKNNTISGGVYYVRLTVNGLVTSQRVTLLK